MGGDERAGNSRPESEPDEFGLAADGAPLGPARFFAGIVVAIATMVFGQIPMAIISRSFPNLFLQVVPLVIAVTLTAGLLVAWISERITRSWIPIRASLFFFAAGFVAGFLWGYAIFKAVTQGFDTSHVLPSVSLPIVGAFYVGSTAGLGALSGRLFADAAARKPRGVMMTAIILVVLAVIGAFNLR